MNDPVDVTISIVTGASAELANRCLDVFEQDTSRAISLGIVVLDNASSDETADRIAERHPEVRVIRQEYRAGFGANHNTIIRSTRSRYVYVVNDDTETPSGVLEGIVAYMDAHPRCAVAGPRIIGADGRQQPSAWRLMTLWVQLVWALSLGQLGAVVSRGPVPRVVGAVSGCAMLLRRDAFEAVGCFDERYFMFSEEADLAQRLRRHGYEVHYVPSVEVMHHGQGSTLSVPERRINEHWRSFRLYTDRWHTRIEAAMLAWLTGVGYALAWIVTRCLRLLPRRLRPGAAEGAAADIYMTHVRRAFGGAPPPGLRELAEEFNRLHRH